MHTRYLLIASAALAVGTAAAAADAPKPEVRPAAQPADRPAPVLMASAEQLQIPTTASDGQAAAPAKRPRAARVTSCRCADQKPER
jgi:hypothetical protein